MSPSTTRNSTAAALDALIVRSPYATRRRLLWQRVRPRYPWHLYKYKTIDPSVPETISYASDLIVDSTLYLSSPSDFNDPFDMTAKVEFQGSLEERRKRFQGLIDKHANDKNWKERRQLLTKFMTRPHAEWAVIAENAHIKNMAAGGVFSFAGDPRSILMWSHYAKNHTGICLQFEIAHDPGTFLGAIPVEYTDLYPIHNWIRDSPKELRHSLLGKFKAWEYEGERRIVIPGRAGTRISFLPEALVSLIFGVRTSDKTIDAVRGLLERRVRKGLPPMKLYRATKHDSSYKLRILRMA